MDVKTLCSLGADKHIIAAWDHLCAAVPQTDPDTYKGIEVRRLKASVEDLIEVAPTLEPREG